MSDKDLAAAAWIELTKTTDTYPTYVKKGKPATSHWTKAKTLLDQIGVAVPTPPPVPTPTPTALVIKPPTGTLAVKDGLGKANEFINYYQPQALSPQDIGGYMIKNYLKVGIEVMSWNPASSNVQPHYIHDIEVSNIHDNPMGIHDGTSEVGIWLGQNADLERCVFGPGNFIDLWTGSMCDGGHYRDLDFIHPEHVAIYHEHVTKNLLVEYFRIGQGSPGQSNSINVEWTYGGVGSSKITWRVFDIYCPAGKAGIFVDAGTWGCVVGDPLNLLPKCRFWGPGDAIAFPKNIAGPTDNIAHLNNIVFENTGRQLYHHDNAIG